MLSPPVCFLWPKPVCLPPQVCNAITRQRKEETVTKLKSKLQDSILVFGFRYKGLDVRSKHACHFAVAVLRG